MADTASLIFFYNLIFYIATAALLENSRMWDKCEMMLYIKGQVHSAGADT